MKIAKGVMEQMSKTSPLVFDNIDVHKEFDKVQAMTYWNMAVGVYNAFVSSNIAILTNVNSGVTTNGFVSLPHPRSLYNNLRLINENTLNPLDEIVGCIGDYLNQNMMSVIKSEKLEGNVFDDLVGVCYEPKIDLSIPYEGYFKVGSTIPFPFPTDTPPKVEILPLRGVIASSQPLIEMIKDENEFWEIIGGVIEGFVKTSLPIVGTIGGLSFGGVATFDF